jgi:hypothetical protein
MRLENKKRQQRAGAKRMTGNITWKTLYAGNIFLSREKVVNFTGERHHRERFLYAEKKEVIAECMEDAEDIQDIDWVRRLGAARG